MSWPKCHPLRAMTRREQRIGTSRSGRKRCESRAGGIRPGRPRSRPAGAGCRDLQQAKPGSIVRSSRTSSHLGSASKTPRRRRDRVRASDLGGGRMRRGEFVALLAAAAAWPSAMRAQQPRNIPRLCFLTFDPGTLQTTRFDAFFQALRGLGYVDGQTITIDYLSADGRDERFPALAAECLRLKADVLAVTTTPGAEAAKAATRTIPIVMLQLGDPVGTGLVDSLVKPGGNITGMTQVASDLAAKRLALLKEAVPGLSRVLVLAYLADPIAPLQVKALKEAARSLGVMLQIQDIGAVDDLAPAFDAGARERADGLLTTVGSIFVSYRARVTELAARYRLPAMYPNSIQVTDADGLMAYQANLDDLYKNAATYVDRLLKGAKPSDLPIQQPTQFTLVVNLKAAKAIGLTIPQSFLRRADELIQ